jgi:hypothetical protein
MNFQTIIAALFVIPIAIVIRTISIWTENYSKLPEKIPMHFNIKGAPNQFWTKRPYIVWVMPGFSIFILATMFFSFYLMPAVTNSFMEEMAAIGLVMSIAMAFMFYRISEGIVAVSLGNAKSIWPFMGLPLVLVILCSLSLATLPLEIMRFHKPALKSVTFSTRINEKYEAVDVRTKFPAGIKTIYGMTQWRYLNGKHKVILRWVTPGGSVFYEYHYIVTNSNRIMVSRHIYSYICPSCPAQAKDRSEPGQWTLRVQLDDKDIGGGQFTISP